MATLTEWLNDRFDLRNEEGIFLAHQPIYGFGVEPSERFHLIRYTITYAIMQELGAICGVRSLLDVGCAEGYKAAMARKFFGISVAGTDLSETACARAKEIFDLDAVPSDARKLPFDNESYDVVLSSETLEHIESWKEAFKEALRVAKIAVIVTVPNESERTVQKNIQSKVEHGHINKFSKNTFDEFKLPVKVRPILAFLNLIPCVFFEYLKPLARTKIGETLASFFVGIDGNLSKLSPAKGWIYVIYKSTPQNLEPANGITSGQVVRFKVAKH